MEKCHPTRWREKIFTVNEQRIRLRLSAGVAAYPETQVKEAHELLLIADEALYVAKRRGRNRSCRRCN